MAHPKKKKQITIEAASVPFMSQSSSPKKTSPILKSTLPAPKSTFTLNNSEDDNSDDLFITTPASSRPRGRNIARSDFNPDKEILRAHDSTPKREISAKEVIIIDDDDDDDDDDLPIATPRSSNTRGRKRAVPVDDDDDGDDDDDDDVVIRSSVKKRRLGRKGSVNTSSQDITTDPLNMYSSVKLRTRGSRPTYRTEKEKQRELLRRRRAGEKIDEEDLSSSEEEDEGEAKALYDTDSQLEALEEFEDEEDSLMERDQKSKKDKRKDRKDESKKARKSEGNSDNQDDDDDLVDFIVSDEDGPIGAPADLDIPLEFTRAAHKSLKEYFRDVVEWLVHKRVNASFDSEQEIHLLAWRKLNDEVSGLAHSNFISSSWKEEFQHLIRERPYIEHWELPKGDRAFETKCHACNRSNHPPTYRMLFSGKPYDKEKLEELDDDYSSGSDSEDHPIEIPDSPDDANVTKGGLTLEDEGREWLVGVNCGDKAVIAHKLMHWRRALKDFVQDYLEHQGWLEAEKCKAREAMKPKKRTKAANQIMKAWEESATISSLYKDFKDLLDGARNDMQKGSGGRYGRRR